MVDISVIAGAISSLRAASDMTRAMVDIRDGQLLQSKVIELQRLILDAQASALNAQADQMDLLGEIDKLRRELDATQNWNVLAERYRLRDFGGNSFAWELVDPTPGEPVHRACSKCWEQQKRGILQFKFKDSQQRDHYQCSGCATEFEFGAPIRPERMSRSNTSGWAV